MVGMYMLQLNVASTAWFNMVQAVLGLLSCSCHHASSRKLFYLLCNVYPYFWLTGYHGQWWGWQAISVMALIATYTEIMAFQLNLVAVSATWNPRLLLTHEVIFSTYLSLQPLQVVLGLLVTVLVLARCCSIICAGNEDNFVKRI